MKIATAAILSISALGSVAVTQPAQAQSYSFSIYECCARVGDAGTNQGGQDFDNYTPIGSGTFSLQSDTLAPGSFVPVETLSFSASTENFTYSYTLGEDDNFSNGTLGVQIDEFGRPWYFTRQGGAFVLTENSKDYAGGRPFFEFRSESEPNLITDEKVDTLNDEDVDVISQAQLEALDDAPGATWLSGRFAMQGATGGERNDDGEIINRDVPSNFQGVFSFNNRYIPPESTAIVYINGMWTPDDDAKLEYARLTQIVQAISTEIDVHHIPNKSVGFFTDFFEALEQKFTPSRNIRRNLVSKFQTLAMRLPGLETAVLSTFAEAVTRRPTAAQRSSSVAEFKKYLGEYSKLIIVGYSQGGFFAIEILEDDQIPNSRRDNIEIYAIATPLGSLPKTGDAYYTTEKKDKIHIVVPKALDDNEENFLSVPCTNITSAFECFLGHSLLTFYFRDDFNTQSKIFGDLAKLSNPQ